MDLNTLITAARGDAPADLLLTNARIVNVFSGRINSGSIAVKDGYVVGLGDYAAARTVDLADRYVAPGFIDAHVHIESAMACVTEFARAVAPCGTTTVVADPHEIANVLGTTGIDYMLQTAEGQPMECLFALPSCVPATEMETAGARLEATDLEPFFDHPRIVALAEMMNYPGVIFSDPQVMAKLLLAPGMLVVLAVLSMAVGNVVAIAQTNIKRMLAYSTISHMGFVLMGLLPGTPTGYGAGMFYVIVYALMSAAAFGMIALLSARGVEAENLDDFKGLNQRNNWYAAVMAMVMFSMAGVPVFVGFFAKWLVIQAVINAGLVWLAIVAVVFSVVGAFYYIRVVKLMYFDKPLTDASIDAPVDFRAVLSLNGVMMLGLGVFSGSLIQICMSSFGA